MTVVAVALAKLKISRVRERAAANDDIFVSFGDDSFVDDHDQCRCP